MNVERQVERQQQQPHGFGFGVRSRSSRGRQVLPNDDVASSSQQQQRRRSERPLQRWDHQPAEEVAANHQQQPPQPPQPLPRQRTGALRDATTRLATITAPKTGKSLSSVPSLAANVRHYAEVTASNAMNGAQEAAEHLGAGERDTIVLLLATALVNPAMNLVGLSPVLGFLFAGMLIGPTGLSWVSDVETTTKLAELGVVFFLFEMGLELELERLKSVGRDAFTLGTAQFSLTTLAIGGLAMAFGATAPAALVLGGGLALSSSAFVIQLLNEKGELASRFGRASFGILLFQDLAVVPLLVVTPLLGGTGAQLGAALRLAAIKSVSALSFIFFAGRVVLQRAYKLVASARDQTSFLAITLVTVLSMAGFTAALGLSDTLGAFLAGVLLAESKYRYQIHADIAPFRGLLLGLFFITTGFSIDLKIAAASWRLVLGGALAIHTLKTLVCALVCIGKGLKPTVALRSGLLLSQGGEFAFVIFALAQQHGLLLPKQVKLLLTTVVFTMFLTPFLNELGVKISASVERSSGKLLLPSPDEAEKANYVLLCGFGRVGQAVAELLTAKLVRYKAFDMDPYRVAEARELGLPVFFGDATRPEVLQTFMKESEANISSVVVTLDTERDCTMAVRALRRLYTPQEMPIFVRAHGDKHRRKLMSSGATAVETGPQESALLLGGALLSSFGFPREEVVSLIDDTRTSMYSTRLRDIFGDEAASKAESNPIKKILGDSLRSPAEKAATKAAEVAAEVAAELESEIAELETTLSISDGDEDPAGASGSTVPVVGAPAGGSNSTSAE